MCRRFDFTAFLADEREEIKKSLTMDEAAVFEHRARGECVVQTALALNFSVRTVVRRSDRIMEKICRMQRRNAGRGE